MISLREPEWLGDQAHALQTFLETEHGKRFLERLEWMRPSFSTSSDPTNLISNAREIHGYENAILTILSLVSPDTKLTQTNSNYPPLEKPEAWEETDAEFKKVHGSPA